MGRDMMAIVEQGQEPSHRILTASTSRLYLRGRFPRLHPFESFDDQVPGFVHAESRTIDNQIVILWIGPVLVEIVLDELVPIPVLGVHEAGGLDGAELAFPGDERNSIVTGGHDPDTQS